MPHSFDYCEQLIQSVPAMTEQLQCQRSTTELSLPFFSADPLSPVMPLVSCWHISAIGSNAATASVRGDISVIIAMATLRDCGWWSERERRHFVLERPVQEVPPLVRQQIHWQHWGQGQGSSASKGGKLQSIGWIFAFQCWRGFA